MFRSLFWIRFKKVMMLVVGVAFVFSLFKALIPPSDRLAEGTPVPKMQLAYITGGEGVLRLPTDLKGKGVLLNFWATWCGPCVHELPVLQRLHERYGQENIVVIGVTDEHPKKVAPFVRDKGLTYPIVRDRGGRLGARLGVKSIPFSVFIGPDGRVVGDVTGELDESEGSERLEELLEKLKG